MKSTSIVTVIGGTGFLGSYIAKNLAATGARIKIISRNAQSYPPALKVAGYVGQVSYVNCDVHDEKQLAKHLRGSDFIVNCIGVLYSKGGQSFEKLHAEFPKKLAQVAGACGCKRLVHISSLGVDKIHGSQYAITKLKGEKAIKESGIGYTIIRPSVMFGPEDNFINMFARFAELLPMLPLIGGGQNKLQPVYVDDVAQAVVKVLTSHYKSSENTVLEVGGPKAYTFEQVLDLLMACKKIHRIKLKIPYFYAKMNAFFLEMMPKPLLTRDQIELLKYDNVVLGDNAFDTLEIKPKALEAIMPTYIS